MSSSVIILKKSPLRVLSGFGQTKSGSTHLIQTQKTELAGVLRFHDIEALKTRNAVRLQVMSDALRASGKHLLSVKIPRIKSN